MPTIKLGGPQENRLKTALIEAFDSDDLMEELLVDVGKRFDHLKVYGAVFPDHIRAVIRTAVAEDWLDTLLEKACEQRPGDTELHLIYADITHPEASAVGGLTSVVDHLSLVLVYRAGDDDVAVRDVRTALADLPVTVRSGQTLTGVEIVVFVLTAGAAGDDRCRALIEQASAQRIPIMAVRADDAVTTPDWLGAAPIIDLHAEEALARHIAYLASPDHELELLSGRRDSLRQRATEAGPGAQRWFNAELDVVDRRMADQRARRDDPAAAQSRAETELSAGIRDEYVTESVTEDTGDVICFGELPVVPPNEFRDRVTQLDDLERHLTDGTTRLVAVVGVAGIGKTGVIARLRHRVITKASPVTARRFVYLPVLGYRPVNAGAVVWGLARTVAEPELIGRLLEVVRRPLPAIDKLDAVLDALERREVILCVDNAEELLDDHGELRDRELGRVIDRLLGRGDHGVRMILSTRQMPACLLERAGDKGRDVLISEGLPADHARDFLHRLDNENLNVLAGATTPDETWLIQLTEGSPRALELAFGVLRRSPGRTVAELVEKLRTVRSEQLVGRLIEWTFDGLDLIDRRIAQALAIYRWPVKPSAVVHLLQDFVPAQRVGPLLDELCRRRIIRRDGSHYYLPRDPDGIFVLDTIEPGDDSAGDPERPQFTQRFLFRRAADYFAALVLPTAKVKDVEDLRPAFVEIDLRICARQFTSAVDLIAAIERAHLLYWGQNAALIPALERLPAFRDDLNREFRRRSLLVRAYKQAEDYEKALECAGEAVMIAQRAGHRNRTISHFLAHSGSCHFERGEVGKAIECYRVALRAVSWTQRSARYERAIAHAGLAACLGRAGFLSSALRHHEAGVRLLPSVPADKAPRLEIFLSISAGWAYSQMGEVERARRVLRAGYDTGMRSEIWELAGRCRHFEADLLLDDGDFSGAITLAGEAADLGLRANSGVLCRNANETLALAMLRGDRLDDAAAAAALAARQDAGLYDLALAGIIAFRQGDQSSARLCFEDAQTLAADRRRLDDADFQTQELHGIVLFGLAMCDGPASVEDSCAALRQARRATSARGAVRRIQRLIRRFEGRVDDAVLTLVLDAAGAAKP